MSPVEQALDLDLIGRYKLVEQIGVGGFGVVYRGLDPYIGRSVAIKVSSIDDVGGDRTEQQSFLRKLFVEAEAAGKLLHPNIVMIYDVGIQEPYYYIAMEYVDGRNLKYHCQPERQLATADIIDVVIKVCHGLDYAHQRGVIHRDIKATNILLGSKGEVKIADFGLAYVDAIKESQLAYAGTPSYMAPEQVRREKPTAQSDIFSLGVVLYELLCGEKPFQGKGSEAVGKAILKEPHVSVKERNLDIPRALSDVVDRALAKDPTERFQDTIELAKALDRVLKEEGESFAPELAEKIRMLGSLQFFSDFDEEEIHRVLQIGTWMNFSGGELIVAQEEQDASFFVLVSGSAKVEKGRKVLGQMNRGQCFGEISFLLDQERTATVSAASDCNLLKLNPKKMDILPPETQAKLYRSFARTLANRLLTADRRTVEQ